MAFRIIRQRKEARRLAKIEEIFADRDKLQRGKLSLEQVQDVYRIYQVELDPKISSKYLDEQGEVSREEFIKLALETKLTEFHVMGELTKSSGPVKSSQDEENTKVPARSNLLCCVTEPELTTAKSPALQRTANVERMKKIERAFRKFDLNGDGFLSWEEFVQIGIDQDTAKRIFTSCGLEESGKLNLEQFQNLVTRDDKLSE